MIEYPPFPPKYERRSMTRQSCLVFSGIAPHPPIMVPEVGRESIAGVVNSIDAMSELTRRLIHSGAESVILISPHAPLEADAFVTSHTSTRRIPTSACQSTTNCSPRSGKSPLLSSSNSQRCAHMISITVLLFHSTFSYETVGAGKW